MATYGWNDTKQYVLPTGWDASELEQIRLRADSTYERLVPDIAAALAVTNGSLVSKQPYAGLLYVTEEVALEYGVGVTSGGMETHTEYGLPGVERGLTTGHMLKISEYDRRLGWTWDFLRKARETQIIEDISVACLDVQNNWEKQVLTALFKSTRTAVGSGWTYPLADGGTADSTYVPRHNPDREATAFTSSHSHLSRLNGITQANLETLVTHLWEHGIDAPYELLVAEADLSSWTNTTNMTGYVKRPDSLIRYGTTQDLAQVAVEYVGAIETNHGSCRLLSNARIPTKYSALYKSYGGNDPRNPLYVRKDSQLPIGAILMTGDHVRHEHPLNAAILFHAFGVNVGRDRVAAIIHYNHTSGSYTDPTIS